MDIPTIERAIDLTELYIADEVFASGTSAFVSPVKEIDKRRVGDGTVGPLTAVLQKKYKEVLHGEDPRYAHLLTVL
jgi:branched-chain amino acid aminotransferase